MSYAEASDWFWNMVTIIATVMVLATIPAGIARMKGWDFDGWWLFAVLLWPIAFIVIILMPDRSRKAPRVRVQDGRIV